MSRLCQKLKIVPPVDIELPDGTSISSEDMYVLQVAIGVKAKLWQMGIDAKTMQARAAADVAIVVEAACDSTGKRRFTPANKEWIFEQPGGGWPEVLARQAAVLMRGPVGVKCAAPKMKEDKPVLDESGKAVLCGCDLPPEEPFCPRCKADAPSAMDIARGN